MDSWKDVNITGGSWKWKSTATVLSDYKERIEYDPNGNILKYLRNGQSSQLKMDSLKYSYYANTNRLERVHDSVGSSNYTGKVDIDNQSTGNYTYDAIGNLITDASEGLSVWWNNAGKIDSIRNTKDTTALRFKYDPTGNRIEKRYYKLASDSTKFIEYYTRDAQGNIMANYKMNGKVAGSLDSLILTEVPLYGSARLGVFKRDTLLFTNAGGNIGVLKDTVPYTEGKKQYELSNHLGNVLATISDRKYPVDTNTDKIAESYIPLVITENDYYPFGMLMPGRSYNAGSYRFSYNGKEQDNEVSGTGNHLDYGGRGRDPRLGGGWWSVDPLAKKFASLSPYAFVANNPLNYIDPDGRDIVVLNDPKGANGAGHQAVLVSDGKGGWNYVSKDAFKGAIPYSAKPVVTVQNFKSIAEFAKSSYNLVQDDQGNVLLDENGNKQQRYTNGYLIKTDPKTDPASFKAAKTEANSNYNLGLDDCSHVCTEALEAAKTPQGKQVKSGETNPQVIIPATKYTPPVISPDYNFTPNEKQKAIEQQNKGTDIDDQLAIPQK